MRVTKEAGIGASEPLDENELAHINRLARKALKAEEVYTFGVRLCDNEIDRDGERFPEQTLGQLAELFVGKSGVFDHQWSARGQTARIYRTELVREESVLTAAGDTYCYVKGWAYMLRTDGNQDLIAEIDGGIKKEVSVGCAVERAVCSVCGGNLEDCGHQKGKCYDGTVCCGELLGATDAYEWSFVAVPAQKNAGVLKQMKGQAEDRERLEREAALGRRYLKQLRYEVARLGGLAETGMDAPVLERIAQRLEEPELLALKQAYEEKLRARYPAQPQLTYPVVEHMDRTRDGAFLI